MFWFLSSRWVACLETVSGTTASTGAHPHKFGFFAPKEPPPAAGWGRSDSNSSLGTPACTDLSGPPFEALARIHPGRRAPNRCPTPPPVPQDASAAAERVGCFRAAFAHVGGLFIFGDWIYPSHIVVLPCMLHIYMSQFLDLHTTCRRSHHWSRKSFFSWH